MSDDIIIAPLVEWCRQNERLTGAFVWVAAPPHVKRHFADCEYPDVCAELARNGYTFTVAPTRREVSMLDWYGDVPTTEPFCACGNRASECDGSRKACPKYIQQR